MEVKRYLDIAWRWWWLLALGTVLAGVTAFVVSKLQQPVYQASVTLLISEAPAGNVSADYTAILTSERLARTYVQILTSRPILETVIQKLNLAITTDDLTKAVAVQVVRDTQLIKLTVEDTNPQLAADIANLLPEVFIESNRSTQISRFSESKQSLLDEIDKIDRLIADTQAQMEALGQPAEAEAQDKLDRLTADLAQLRQGRTGLVQSYENLRLSEAKALTNVVVVEPARAADEPIRPRTLVNTLLAAAVGLLLAAGIVLLIEYLDDTIKTPDQATALLNLSVIGVVARMSKDEMSRGLVTQVEPRSPVTEAFRTLRTNLQFASIDRPLRRLLVTSVGPGEGKSTVTANLATVFAQAGQRVTVIDADMRRPTLNKVFGQPEAAGLADVMLHEPLHLDGALQPLSTPNLFFLSHGAIPPNPAELLGSKKMTTLLDLLGQQADLVLLDTPPATAVTDALVLSSKVDGVILVIDVGHTRAGAAVHAKEQLERLGANLLGIVLNKAPIQRGGYYYSSYYYYHHDYDTDGSAARANGHKPFWAALFKPRKRKLQKTPAADVREE